MSLLRYFIILNHLTSIFDVNVIQFGALADVDVVPCDISVAGRVLATFPEKLKDNQRVPDNLSYLGEICKTVSMIVSCLTQTV